MILAISSQKLGKTIESSWSALPKLRVGTGPGRGAAHSPVRDMVPPSLCPAGTGLPPLKADPSDGE